jgi:hypothetical protein
MIPSPNRFPILVLAAGVLFSGLAPAAAAAAVLKSAAFKHHVETFNAAADEPYANAIPNAKAWDFLADNMPLFECPDEDLERTYYFRWWTYLLGFLEAVPEASEGMPDAKTHEQKFEAMVDDVKKATVLIIGY